MQSTAPPATTTGLRWRNWAGNQSATAAAVLHPASTDEVAAAVTRSITDGRRLKPVGNGHSFTDICHTDDQRMDLSGLSGLIAVDPANHLVTVGAGTPLHALNRLLAAHGLALPNLGDIDVQTVAGALSTGTHGTGARYGCLSTFVAGFTLVTGTGTVLRCTAEENPDVFAAGRVGLGALGVLTDVTLRCTDAFLLHADERPTALADVLARLDEHIAANDHVEFYWFPYTDRAQLKRNNRVPSDHTPLHRLRGWLADEFLANTVYAAVCRLGRRLPAAVPTLSAICARALSPRSYTGPSDRVFCTSRRVRFTEMEYALPRAALPEALAALPRLIADLPFRVQFPVEVRFTAADDIWLSHGYGRDSAYIAVHQYIGMPYEPYFRAFERVCTDLDGRPHWGKLHYRDAASLRPTYPRFDDFLALRNQLDPHRLLANPYTDRVLGH